MGWQWVGWFGEEELFPLDRNCLVVRVLSVTGIAGIVLRRAPPKDAFGGLNGVFIRVLPATGITGIVLRKAPPKDAFGGTMPRRWYLTGGRVLCEFRIHVFLGV